MKINLKRFVLRRMVKNGKYHIFPKTHQRQALCLRGPADTDEPAATVVPDNRDICRECAHDYPAVSRSPFFRMFTGV